MPILAITGLLLHVPLSHANLRNVTLSRIIPFQSSYSILNNVGHWLQFMLFITCHIVPRYHTMSLLPLTGESHNDVNTRACYNFQVTSDAGELHFDARHPQKPLVPLPLPGQRDPSCMQSLGKAQISSLQLQPQNVPHVFLHLTCSCLYAQLPRQSTYKDLPQYFSSSSLSHFTSFACIHLFCPRFIIIIFAASPSRGQAADTKQGSTIAPDSRHISLESSQSLSTHRIAGFYLIALLDRGRVSGQHLLLPAVQHSWRATINREPSLSSPVLPTSAPYGYKTPQTEFAHLKQRQISSAIRTFESTTTRRRLKRRAAAGDRGQEEKILIHPPSSRLGSIKREAPVLLFHNGQPCLARSPKPIWEPILFTPLAGRKVKVSETLTVVVHDAILNPIDSLWNPVDIASQTTKSSPYQQLHLSFPSPFGSSSAGGLVFRTRLRPATLRQGNEKNFHLGRSSGTGPVRFPRGTVGDLFPSLFWCGGSHLQNSNSTPVRARTQFRLLVTGKFTHTAAPTFTRITGLYLWNFFFLVPLAPLALPRKKLRPGTRNRQPGGVKSPRPLRRRSHYQKRWPDFDTGVANFSVKQSKGSSASAQRWESSCNLQEAKGPLQANASGLDDEELLSSQQRTKAHLHRATGVIITVVVDHDYCNFSEDLSRCSLPRDFEQTHKRRTNRDARPDNGVSIGLSPRGEQARERDKRSPNVSSPRRLVLQKGVPSSSGKASEYSLGAAIYCSRSSIHLSAHRGELTGVPRERRTAQNSGEHEVLCWKSSHRDTPPSRNLSSVFPPKRGRSKLEPGSVDQKRELLWFLRAGHHALVRDLRDFGLPPPVDLFRAHSHSSLLLSHKNWENAPTSASATNHLQPILDKRVVIRCFAGVLREASSNFHSSHTTDVEKIPSRARYIKLGHVRAQKTNFLSSIIRPHTKVTCFTFSSRLDIGATPWPWNHNHPHRHNLPTFWGES
ncbi:uncharacterized protein CLUP02_16640 [Colletotrichum lupini]|uniref:Uncharacterized protein n=1 Tax=Colletotrichum lupini TaxID=145971 RepID=A0A9Q8TAI4_9PEZI|nr:uncharacterized protein CLUP02_16640 [Colletotrichum lupini]UQC91106.1 hypothetical protein CLUP02_16640 [Colletotrichum lupini]